MLNNTPITRCTKKVYHPPQMIQMRLHNAGRQPVICVSLTTRLPKGINTSPANLKHCKPHGMPTMVIHKRNPPIIYPNAANKPPNISQMRLPNKFMIDDKG